jgi:hypothetical protein
LLLQLVLFSTPLLLFVQGQVVEHGKTPPTVMAYKKK